MNHCAFFWIVFLSGRTDKMAGNNKIEIRKANMIPIEASTPKSCNAGMTDKESVIKPKTVVREVKSMLNPTSLITFLIASKDDTELLTSRLYLVNI